MMLARVNVWGYEVDVVMMILCGVMLFWGMVVLRLCKTLWIIHRGGISVLRPGIATITSLFESEPEKLFTSLSKDLQQQSSGIVGWLTPVGKPFLVVNDEKVLSQIIVENQANLTKHHAFGVLEYFRQTNLSGGDAWRVVHKLSSRFPINKKSVTDVIQPRLQRFCSEVTASFDFAEYTKEFYWGMVLILVTGIDDSDFASGAYDFNSLRNLYKLAWTASIVALGQPLAHMFSFYMYLPLPSVFRYRYYSTLLRNELRNIIMSGDCPSWSVIGVAADMHLSLDDQLEVAMEFMFTGASSVTSVLVWLMYHIAQNKPLQSSIRGEITSRIEMEGHSECDTEIGSRLFGWAKIGDTSSSSNVHLDAALRESLRLYSPIHIGRLVLQDFSIDDANGNRVHIARDTDIMSNMWFIHRSERNWGKTANSFDHTRFLSLPHNTPNFHPFSMGVRSCPGKKIADAIIKQIAGNLVLNYDICEDEESSKGACFEHNLMLPVTPLGVYLKFTNVK